MVASFNPEVKAEVPQVSAELIQRVKDLSDSYAKERGLRIKIDEDFTGTLPLDNFLTVYLATGNPGYENKVHQNMVDTFNRIAGLALHRDGSFAHFFEPDRMERNYSKEQDEFSEYIFSNVEDLMEF